MKKFITSLLFLLLACGTLSAADITATLLTNGTEDPEPNDPVLTTASITPSSNQLILIVTSAIRVTVSVPSAPTITGNSLTWVHVASATSAQRIISVHRAMGGSPTTGVITITYADDMYHGGWVVSEFDNVDTGGSNGADAVVQSATNTADPNGTSLTMTLAAFSNVKNATFGGFVSGGANGWTPGSGFAELADNNGGLHTTPMAEWVTTNDISVDATVSSSLLQGVALEIKNATQAVHPTVLTEALEGADQNSYATASVAPSNNVLIIATVKQVRAAGSPTKPTCSGNGLTWVEIGHVEYGTVASPLFAVTIFRAMSASPSSGAVTFDFSGQTQDLAVWSVIEYANVNTGGTNGSGAIVQNVSGSPLDTQTAYSVTLSAFSDANNATLGIIGDNLVTGIVVGSGFTELVYREGLQVQFRFDNDTSVDWTKDSSHVGGWAGEIKSDIVAASGASVGVRGARTGFIF